MYDFWFTLGAATIYPTDLVDKQIAPCAKFNFVPRVVVEFNSGLQTRSGPSTGLIERANSTMIRQRIAAYLKLKFGTNAPPVGIYTAGRFCQLVNIPYFDSHDHTTTFASILANANAAYTAATSSTAPASPKFPGALGMCLVDVQVPGLISTADMNIIPEILGEFQIAVPSSDFSILQTIVNDPRFQLATQTLMGGDNNPWFNQGNTPEQMIFWPNDGSLRGEHVVA